MGVLFRRLRNFWDSLMSVTKKLGFDAFAHRIQIKDKQIAYYTKTTPHRHEKFFVSL